MKIFVIQVLCLLLTTVVSLAESQRADAAASRSLDTPNNRDCIVVTPAVNVPDELDKVPYNSVFVCSDSSEVTCLTKANLATTKICEAMTPRGFTYALTSASLEACPVEHNGNKYFIVKTKQTLETFCGYYENHGKKQ